MRLQDLVDQPRIIYERGSTGRQHILDAFHESGLSPLVALETTVQHPLYKKRIRRTARIKAHDAENACHVGDRVEVMETRPLSKEKRWRLLSIVETAK